jgi:hypothetical protein
MPGGKPRGGAPFLVSDGINFNRVIYLERVQLRIEEVVVMFGTKLLIRSER